MTIPGKASMFIKTGFHKRCFYELPIIIDRFFVECLNIAALKILCGKNMIMGVIRVPMKENEEPFFSN